MRCLECGRTMGENEPIILYGPASYCQKCVFTCLKCGNMKPRVLNTYTFDQEATKLVEDKGSKSSTTNNVCLECDRKAGE